MIIIVCVVIFVLFRRRNRRVNENALVEAETAEMSAVEASASGRRESKVGTSVEDDVKVEQLSNITIEKKLGSGSYGDVMQIWKLSLIFKGLHRNLGSYTCGFKITEGLHSNC